MKKIFIAFCLFLANFTFVSASLEKEESELKSKIEKNFKKQLEIIDKKVPILTEEKKFEIKKTVENFLKIYDGKYLDLLKYLKFKIDSNFDFYDYLAKKNISLKVETSDFLPKNQIIEKILKKNGPKETKIKILKNSGKDINGTIRNGEIVLFMDSINKENFKNIYEKNSFVNEIIRNEMMHIFLEKNLPKNLENKKYKNLKFMEHKPEGIKIKTMMVEEFLSDYSTISEKNLSEIHKLWFINFGVESMLYEYEEIEKYSYPETYAFKSYIYGLLLEEVLGKKKVFEILDKKLSGKEKIILLVKEMENKKVDYKGKTLNGWEYFREIILEQGNIFLKNIFEN